MKPPDVRVNFPHEMRLGIYTRADMAAMGQAVFEAVEADPGFAPQKHGLYEPYKASPLEARRLWQGEAAKSFGLLGGYRKKPFYVSLNASFGIDAIHPFHMIWMSFALPVLRHDGARRIEALFRRLVTVADP